MNSLAAGALVILLQMCQVYSDIFDYRVPADGKKNFTGIGEEHGYKVEEHRIITEDGYILRVYHIPGDKTKPVLLQHGVEDSGDSFILRGDTSLALVLAKAGYDVWVSNSRGNWYSRDHVTLDPDTDKAFWNYTFNELGFYDIPACIDYILAYTLQTSLYCIGHSQGTQIFFVLGSTRPEYNDKIRVFIALAPICFLNHLRPPDSTVQEAAPLMNDLMLALGIEEVYRDGSITKDAFEAICTKGIVGYVLCMDFLLFPFAGYDAEQMGVEFTHIVWGHYPQSTSRKNLLHTGQITRRHKFAKFDNGIIGNMMAYGSIEPPEYDLQKVRMNVALFHALNDKLSVVGDVEELRAHLPNVVEYKLIDRLHADHYDFVWGKDAYIYLYPDLISVMEKYMTPKLVISDLIDSSE